MSYGIVELKKDNDELRLLILLRLPRLNEALTYHYYVKDHLGNHRIVQTEKGKVTSAKDHRGISYRTVSPTSTKPY
jgi:hypothetical protein